MIDSINIWIVLKTDRRAVSALEYTLIASAIALTIMFGFKMLGADV